MIFLKQSIFNFQIEYMTPPLTPFLNINKISISDKRSHFTLVFLKAACHANPVAERNFPGSRQNCQTRVDNFYYNTNICILLNHLSSLHIQENICITFI